MHVCAMGALHVRCIRPREVSEQGLKIVHLVGGVPVKALAVDKHSGQALLIPSQCKSWKNSTSEQMWGCCA
jgi:hypothetical protein